MNDRSPEIFEQWLDRTAAALPYPPTPDLIRSIDQRRSARPVLSAQRVAWIAVALIAVLSLAAVPHVRASVLALLRIGSIEIVASPPPFVAPSAAPLPDVLRDLAGSTTLAAAREQVGFPIKLPTQPIDLGPPDQVYLQQLSGPAVILVWLDPQQPGRIKLSLDQLSSEIFARKLINPAQLNQTTVSGQPAAWVSGAHLFELIDRDGNTTIGDRRLVDGNTLIWTQDGMTYRLQSDLDLDQARSIAESLKE